MRNAHSAAGEDASDTRPPRRALVVFSGYSDLKWLRWLRPGFRHCFVLLETGVGWVLINPLSNGTEVDIWPEDQEEALRAWFVQNGYEVIDETVQPLASKALPWSLYSCVEVVKRLLGLRDPRIVTPWQLYRFLKNEEKGKKSLTCATD